jgi:hypothetical protein
MLLENPVEATTIVQIVVLLLVENVVWKNISEIIRLISKKWKKWKKKMKWKKMKNEKNGKKNGEKNVKNVYIVRTRTYYKSLLFWLVEFLQSDWLIGRK